VEQVLVTCEAVKGFKEHAVTWFLNKKDFNIEDLLHPKFCG
jgi:hypothetical protein